MTILETNPIIGGDFGSSLNGPQIIIFYKLPKELTINKLVGAVNILQSK